MPASNDGDRRLDAEFLHFGGGCRAGPVIIEVGE